MPTDDDLIDAAPCPKCKAPLAVVAADLGYLIECPSCGTQSRARRAADPPPADAPAPPRKRNWDGDARDDERQPSRGREFDEEDGDDRRPRDRRRDDRDDRRGRARYRNDDYDDDRPVRRPGQGAAVAAAVMNFVFAGVALIEGICVGFSGTMVLSEGGRGGQGPFGSPENAGLVFLGFGVCNLLGVGLMIPAGIGLLQRRDYGRTLGFLAAGLGLVYALSIAVLFIVGISNDGGRGPDAEAIFVILIPILLWLAFAITNLILLGKVRRLPTR